MNSLGLVWNIDDRDDQADCCCSTMNEYDVLEGTVTRTAIAGRTFAFCENSLDQGVLMGRSLEQSLIKEPYEQGKLEPEKIVTSV